MTVTAKKQVNTKDLEAMLEAGVHFGLSKSRRHPSTKPFIFGSKNRIEIFDLEKVSESIEKTKDFIREIAKTGENILLIGGKSEARDAVEVSALSMGIPYVKGRFIGGSLTNFSQIRGRIEKMEKLLADKEKGLLGKYTKKERLLIDREIENLEEMFGGIASMKSLPGAIVVVDPKKEKIALKEAKVMNIPVVAIANSDCNIKEVDYAIVGNDASVSSITYLLGQIVDAFKEGIKLSQTK